MLEIKLNYNYGYKWFESDGIHVKGYLYDSNNNLYSEEKLIEYFKKIQTIKEFSQKIKEANGVFSVIINTEFLNVFAVDRIRTFPLFYSKHNNTFYISDDAYNLQDTTGNKVNKLNSYEFLSTGYITNKGTLIDNIFQLEAGKFVSFENGFKKHTYFHYLTDESVDDDYQFLKDKFLSLLDSSVTRAIKFANGRQIVLPLSGGYDSRLIATLLKKNKYHNVYCFTYGSKDSFEVDISKKVADKLGFTWKFIEYNEETIPQDFPLSEEFLKYYKFASNHVSIFLTQDYFAVKYVNDNCLIDEDAIFMPGHTGDFICGGHIKNCRKSTSTKTLINDIINTHYNLNKNADLGVFKERLNNLKNIDKFSYSIYEDWELKERQSKFIVNANRVYEYFNYKHIMPLWDASIIEFFRVMPLNQKLNSLFYIKVIFEELFKSYDIDYKKVNKSNGNISSKIKSFVKLFLPSVIQNKLIQRKFKDINKTSMRALPLLKEIDEKIHFSDGNLIIAKWILSKGNN